MVKRQKIDVYQVITNQVLDAIDYAKANNIKLNWTISWKSGKAISRPLRSVPFGTHCCFLCQQVLTASTPLTS